MYFYTTIILTLVIDTITKLSAQNYLTEKINLLWDFVFLEYILNTWIAFSIQVPTLLLKTLTIVLIIVIFYYYKTEKKLYNNSKLYDMSFWLILWGALWNAYERIFHEEVIDFLWIKYFSIMNFADIFISIWAILYIYLIYKNRKTK
jgi:lipoprotein signal peptidase